MQLEQYTKKQLIEIIKKQQRTNTLDVNFYLKRIESLEQEIRELKEQK